MFAKNEEFAYLKTPSGEHMHEKKNLIPHLCGWEQIWTKLRTDPLLIPTQQVCLVSLRLLCIQPDRTRPIYLPKRHAVKHDLSKVKTPTL